MVYHFTNRNKTQVANQMFLWFNSVNVNKGNLNDLILEIAAIGYPPEQIKLSQWTDQINNSNTWNFRAGRAGLHIQWDNINKYFLSVSDINNNPFDVEIILR